MIAARMRMTGRRIRVRAIGLERRSSLAVALALLMTFAGAFTIGRAHRSRVSPWGLEDPSQLLGTSAHAGLPGVLTAVPPIVALRVRAIGQSVRQPAHAGASVTVSTAPAVPVEHFPLTKTIAVAVQNAPHTSVPKPPQSESGPAQSAPRPTTTSSTGESHAGAGHESFDSSG